MRHISTIETLRSHFFLSRSRYERFKERILAELQLRKIPEQLNNPPKQAALCTSAFKIEGFMAIVCAYFAENRIAAVVGKNLMVWEATTGSA